MSLLKQGSWVLAIAGAVIGGGVAHAATETSSANAATVRIGTVNAISPDAVSGTATGTAAYSNGGTLASFGQTANLASVGTATLSERVGGSISNERATGGPAGASGTVTLAAPTFAFDSSTTLPFVGTTVATLFGIDADAITSTSTISNVNGTLTAVGLSSIGNLRLSGLAAPLATLVGTLPLNPAANLSFSLGGLTLTLNEQIRSMAAGALSLETNALHLSLNNYAIGGTALTGDVILGHSAASVAGATPAAAAVPEPAAWAMMLAGFGLVGATLRTARRRRPGPIMA